METQYAFLEELIEQDEKGIGGPECDDTTEKHHTDPRTYLKE
jgi:hypothetical protein